MTAPYRPWLAVQRNAARGLRQFPLVENTRQPLRPGWIETATCDLRQLHAAWHRLAPDGGLMELSHSPAVLTGGDILVIDIDQKHGKEGLKNYTALYGSLPETLTVATQNHGLHLYCWTPMEVASSTSELADGVDLKCWHSFVRAPDDLNYRIVKDLPIALVPDAIFARCKPPREKAHRAPADFAEENSPLAIAMATERAKSARPGITGQGHDNAAYLLGCRMHDCGVDEHAALEILLEHWNPRCVPPLDVDDLGGKVRNAYRYCQEPLGSRNPETILRRIEVEAPEYIEPPKPEPQAGATPAAAGGELSRIFDPSMPAWIAEEFLRRFYTTHGQLTLRHAQATFMRWHAASNCYVELSDAALRSEIQALLDGAYEAVGKPFRTTSARCREVLEALRNKTQLPDGCAAPSWSTPCQEGDDPLAHELVAFPNGLLHLPTRRLLPATPRLFNRNGLSFAYDPGASAPLLWLKFLRSLFGDDIESIEVLQECIGLLVSGETGYQKIFVIIGPKRAGKGVTAQIITGLIGRENVVSPTIASLATNFGLQPLIGKSVAIIQDARIGSRTDAQALAERLLSISGEDSLTIDRKFKDPWTGRLPVRFVYISNHIPDLADASGALASRFIVLRLEKSFLGAEDPLLAAKLLKELPSIFNWALVGYDRLKARGFMRQPASSASLIQAVEELAAPVMAFVRDRCEIAQDGEAVHKHLYGRWRRWCEEHGIRPVSPSHVFTKDLLAAFPQLRSDRPRVDGRKIRTVFGLRLKPPLELGESEP